MKTEELELKPCPFCGTDVELIESGSSFLVKCPNVDCQASIKFKFIRCRKVVQNSIIEAWNRRTVEK